MIDSQIESSRQESLVRAQGLPGQSESVNSLLRMPRQGACYPTAYGSTGAPDHFEWTSSFHVSESSQVYRKCFVVKLG
jgi:hypothetical protein